MKTEIPTETGGHTAPSEARRARRILEFERALSDFHRSHHVLGNAEFPEISQIVPSKSGIPGYENEEGSDDVIHIPTGLSRAP